MQAIFKATPRFSAPGHQEVVFHASANPQEVPDWVRETVLYKRSVQFGKIIEVRSPALPVVSRAAETPKALAPPEIPTFKFEVTKGFEFLGQEHRRGEVLELNFSEAQIISPNFLDLIDREKYEQYREEHEPKPLPELSEPKPPETSTEPKGEEGQDSGATGDAGEEPEKPANGKPKAKKTK